MRLGSIATLLLAAPWAALAVAPRQVQPVQVGSPLGQGQVVFEFDPAALSNLGWELAIHDPDGDIDSHYHLISEITAGSRIEYSKDQGPSQPVHSVSVHTSGGVLVVAGDRRSVLGNLVITPGDLDQWRVVNGLDQRTVFELSSVTMEAPVWAQALRIAGELAIAPDWAAELGQPTAAGTVVGRVVIAATILAREDATVDAARVAPVSPPEPGTTATVIGPDVIVGDLHQVQSYPGQSGISPFAVGTVSCNIGDVWLNWVSNTNQHPVIGQNMFRLKNSRFEHIGQSWLKHGFYALSERLCYSNCVATDGTHLGVHCSDPYSAGLNGQQPNLGPKYEVNANNGYFNYPFASPPYGSSSIARRLQVANSDLDPSLNGGGTYFVEGQYVTPDDAAAGNQNNNASYRRITVSGGGSSWTIALTSSTQRQQAGIRAWKDTDPSVVETDIQVPGEGLFILAAKVTDLGNGYWHYEYAVQNLNSHRSARAFSVPIDPTGKILNIGFHDVNYHSGEPFFQTDWTPVVASGTISWSTADFASNQLANALRWGTLYNFRFDANRPPQPTDITLTLFRPGTPEAVTAATVGPVTNSEDCNGNGVADSLDIQNGTSRDCDGDLIPDECQPVLLAATRVATGLDDPVYVTSPPGDLSRLFIVEQVGRIKILTGGAILPAPFLDISDRVTASGERGLLSIAFSPNYSSDGHFYAQYNDLAGDIVIARYSVTADPNVANPGSEVILKTINHQDFDNHSGGQLHFGPDAFLYAGIGDGGSGNDPFNRAQDPSTLLGKMLRLDVDNPPTYVPSSNPFAASGLPADEIWAFGVRNPWRFSFDRETGDLYIADVGQAEWEEIDFQPAASPGGENYGWRCMEGAHCTGLSGCTCNGPALTLPILEYSHSGGDCSVTGGYVYRGCALPNLLGTYFYADFCSDTIRSFRYSGATVTDHQDRTAQLIPPEGPITSIVSFGEDAAGELYIVSYGGDIYKIVPAAGSGPECGNGIVEAGEECDDGDTIPGDGCDGVCQVENAAPNDLCANAQPVGDGVYAFNTTDANTDGPSESTACPPGNPAIGSDIWYCYTPPCTGTAVISLCGSNYDTSLAVYGNCACPASSPAQACNDDYCGVDSRLSVAVSACDPVMIRVGGFDAAQGAGTLTITCQAVPIVNDCDENGVDDATDIACGTHVDHGGNGIPDLCEVDGDLIRGGRMYDRWWSEVAVSEPTSDHPLWVYRPDNQTNTATGSATWRCVECHGWDYKGVDGQYASGPHRTGIPGILGTTTPVPALFDLLKEPPNNGGGPGVNNGHDYGSVLTDQQINDVLAFALTGALDTDPYVVPTTGEFDGDPVAGQTRYTTGGSISQCVNCHGSDGTAINFGTEQDPEYLGTAALYEPWRFLHRTRMGFPGTPMLGWLANGGTTQGAADIGRYAQLSFPPDCLNSSQCNDGVDCTVDICGANGRCVHMPDDAACSDDGLFCSGPEVCDRVLGCIGAGNPCLDPAACDEPNDGCGCAPPIVAALGSRYLSISPQPAGSPFSTRILITAICATEIPKYAGYPAGTYNIAYVVDEPESAGIGSPDDWGNTFYTSGMHIVPEMTYAVQADCGAPGSPVLTLPVMVTTPKFGDITARLDSSGPPDGTVDAVDVAVLVNGFRGLPDTPPLYTLDLYGCVPNKIIDAIDVVGAVDAFRGFGYPTSACPGPCTAAVQSGGHSK
jgi:hypothetical protein